MKNVFFYFQKLTVLAIAHKVISAAVIILVGFGGYSGYKKFTDTSSETRYVIAAVQKGTIVSSITGSGQVATSNQVDIKSKVSGDVVYVGVSSGQGVRAGVLIAQLDARDAEKAVRDAEVSLESAQITLEKLKGPDGLAIPRNKAQAQEDLAKSYDDGFNNVSNAFLDLPTVMNGLQNILLGTDKTLGGAGQSNIDYYSSTVQDYDVKVIQFKNDAYDKYQQAKKNYDQNFDDYKSTNRSSSTDSIEFLIDETYDTTKIIADAIKSANNLIQFYVDNLIDRNLKPQALADAHLSSLNNYTGTTNSHLLDLLNSRNTIKNDKDAILNSDLDIRSQQLSVKQKENALLDAKEKLSDYYIRAPFDGTIAKLNIKKLDVISSATVVATLITKQKIAEISLNEVDVAKLKIGQKATLTFDAVEGLSIAGQVSEIDTIGTVSQGVVTYNIKISFDTQDERVKSGMSVSTAVITDVKQDVLTVPNSAVKLQGETYYVEMFDQPFSKINVLPGQGIGSQGVTSEAAPKQQPVEIGISNDNLTEIISGLKEGDQIVVRTITAVKAATAQQAPNIFGATGGNRSFGGGAAGTRISR